MNKVILGDVTSTPVEEMRGPIGMGPDVFVPSPGSLDPSGTLSIDLRRKHRYRPSSAVAGVGRVRRLTAR